MIVWIDAAGVQAELRVFGLTVVERHLRALLKAAAKPEQIILELGTGGGDIRFPAELAARLNITHRRTPGDLAARLQPVLAEAAGRPLMLLDAHVLADSRLHDTLARLDHSTVVLAPKRKEAAAMVFLAPGHAIGDLLNAAVPDVNGLAHRLIEAQRAAPLADAEFNGFIRKLRRTLPYYLFRIDSARKAAKVERFMFWSNYKGSTDLFTRYVYPPLVWLLVRPLARWRVHPNLVTLASILLAFGAIPLWMHGEFLVGFIMAYAMSVLDSVDGKLARLTFTDSRLGNFLDHGLDMVHPPMWYVVWAYGLGIGVEGWDTALGRAAVAVVVFYVLDRLILKIYPRFFQRAFHTHSRLDGRVRSFIARRNISLPVFMVGYFAGLGREAFYLIVAWQIATALYHGTRTFWILAVQRAHRKGHRPTDVAGAVADLD